MTPGFSHDVPENQGVRQRPRSSFLAAARWVLSVFAAGVPGRSPWPRACQWQPLTYNLTRGRVGLDLTDASPWYHAVCIVTLFQPIQDGSHVVGSIGGMFASQWFHFGFINPYRALYIMSSVCLRAA